MTTEHTLAALYRGTCSKDREMLASVDVSDLVDLANGRLAGERRERIVEMIASSPSLARAYRLAKASGEWSRVVAADLARDAGHGSTATVRALPFRHARPAIAARRHPFAMAAAVSALAIGAVFVAQRMQAPEPGADAGYAVETSLLESGDAILVTSFDAARQRAEAMNADTIFSARGPADDDRIFASGKDS